MPLTRAWTVAMPVPLVSSASGIVTPGRPAASSCILIRCLNDESALIRVIRWVRSSRSAVVRPA